MKSKHSLLLCAGLTVLLFSLAGCKPRAEPVAKLESCIDKLRVAPPIFSIKPLDGLSAPAIDLNDAAFAECLDATATMHRKEVDARAAEAEHTLRGVRAWLSGLADLAEIRTELDRTLDRLYDSKVTASPRGIDLRPLMAVALFDYSRRVRESVADRMHTRVASLHENTFCAGDLIESRLLWRYFDAALRARGGERDADADAARALRSIAIQTSCLGDRQLFDLDSALTSAWDQLVQHLQGTDAGSLLKEIEPAVFQVRLIVFDATKHFGKDAPGYRWFVTREDLRKKMRDQAVWPLHEVIWFYDRKSAGLAAIKTQCNDGGAGAHCINLAILNDTLVNPVAFGMGECSLLEMVQGGIRNVGGAPAYSCTGGACGTPTLDGRIPNTKLAATFLAAYRNAGAGYVLPKKLSKTPFGIDIGEAQGLLCGGKSGSGLGGLDDSAGMSGVGMGATGDVLACVVGVKAERTASLVPGSSCIARFVQTTNPLSKNFESMAATNYAGVPRGCEISDQKSDDDKKKEADEKKKKEEAEKKAEEEAAKKRAEEDRKKKEEIAKQVQDKAKEVANQIRNSPEKRQGLIDAAKKEGITITNADIDKALDKLEHATVDFLVNVTGTGTTGGVTDLDGNITIDMVIWQTAAYLRDTEGVRAGIMEHEFVHSALSSYWKNEWNTKYNNVPGADPAEFKLKRESTDTHIGNGSGVIKNKRCVQGSTSCNDRCNGMAKQTQQAVACLANALNPTTSPPRPNDLVTDPIEPEGRGSDLAKCFADVGDIAGAVAAKQCAAVRCANGNAGYSQGGCCQAGGVQLEGGMSGRRQNICEVARCEASYSGGAARGVGSAAGLNACGCNGGYAGAPPSTTGGPGLPLPSYPPPSSIPFPPR